MNKQNILKIIREKYQTIPLVCRINLQKSFEEFASRCEPTLHVKPKLDESQELAFYNVIDHRCDRMEDAGVPKDKICDAIKKYTEKFISGHIMSTYKEKELRTFSQTICDIYNHK